MFEWMAEEVVTYLIQKKKLDIEARNEYEYGVEVILLNFVALVGCLLVSVGMKQWIEYGLFLVFFIPVRTKLGGMHLKKSEVCMLTSNVLYGIMLWCIKECEGMHTCLIWGNLIVMLELCIAAWIKPLKNEVQQLSQEQEKKNKKKLCLYMIIYCFVFLLFVLNNIYVGLACQIVFLQGALLLYWIEKVREFGR